MPPDEKNDQCSVCKRAFARAEGAGAFCSKRCRMIDFGSWLGGDYRIVDNENFPSSDLVGPPGREREEPS